MTHAYDHMAYAHTRAWHGMAMAWHWMHAFALHVHIFIRHAVCGRTGRSSAFSSTRTIDLSGVSLSGGCTPRTLPLSLRTKVDAVDRTKAALLYRGIGSMASWRGLPLSRSFTCACACVCEDAKKSIHMAHLNVKD